MLYRADMSNIICTNEVGGSGSRMSPERRCSPFIYDRDQCKYLSQSHKVWLLVATALCHVTGYFYIKLKEKRDKLFVPIEKFPNDIYLFILAIQYTLYTTQYTV